MPVVQVMWYPRSQEQKAQVAKAITEAIVKIGGARPEGTTVIFQDVDPGDWAIGGLLGSSKREERRPG